MVLSDDELRGSLNRRTHRKSRTGCLVCKRRRVKCDEGRPHCAKCLLGQRPCSYAYANSGPSSSRPGLPSPSQTHTGPSSTPSVRTPATSTTALQGTNLGPGPGPFTASHLALFYHAIVNMEVYMALQGSVEPMITIALEGAETAPYVLHQMLALAAAHRSYTDAATANSFHHQATELQTHALSLFNDASVHLSESNYIHPFLFATLLGVHVLHDTLVNHSQELPRFVGAFISYLRIHRGVRAVTKGYWEQIVQSELKPLLFLVQFTEAASSQDHGTETDDLRNCLERSCDASGTVVTTSLDALRWIQWVLDVAKKDAADPKLGVHAALAWPIVIADEYIDALYQHRPEPLAVLAFYAAILHQYKWFWVFDTSGSVLFNSITSHIGEYWMSSMTWAQQTVAEKRSEVQVF